jgi:ankyrin repeat-rich membrane spanning protein
MSWGYYLIFLDIFNRSCFTVFYQFLLIIFVLRVRPQIPVLKDVEPLLELDRDERKFDIFLTYHRSSLLVSDLKIFLPFTINLDPYIKKVVKGEFIINSHVSVCR